MRKILTFVLLAGVAITACNKYDDSELRSKINDHEKRIVSLEDQCARMNTNITSINTLLAALQDNDFVKSVVPVNKDGATIGYTITFSKSDPITIYHGTNGQAGEPGATPQIGVKKHTDGKYYWTLNGEWIVDSNSNKIPATGENGQNGNPGERGITPNLKIEDDFWWVSYDNGSTWSKLSKATGADGDSMFESVVVDEENNKVTFNLADGNSVTLPFGRAELIRFAEEGDLYWDSYKQNNEFIVVDINTDPANIKDVIVSYEPMEVGSSLTRSPHEPWYTISLKLEGNQIQFQSLNVDVNFPNAVLTVTVKAESGELYSISKIIHNTSALHWNGVSNCYIIPVDENAGDVYVQFIAAQPTAYGRPYYLDRSKIVSAELLWQSSPGEVINESDVYYDEETNVIELGACPEVPGNAVIAARDAYGYIVYTWHIWTTEPPKDLVSKNGMVVMDRNLGAASATPGDPGSLGLMYQWGNKNPFLGSSSTTSNTKALSTNPEVWGYAPNTDLRRSPTKFSTKYTPAVERLWAYDRQKNGHDPCPSGYRVMGPFLYYSANDMTFDAVNRGIYVEDIWYPAAGYLDTDGSLKSVGSTCYLRVAIQGTKFIGLNFKAGYDHSQKIILTSQDTQDSSAGSVRCMKE